tara:strand:+ start:182544 stop:183686 length:1143 start_codon:yes stop_codon:yes gene_type:complete
VATRVNRFAKHLRSLEQMNRRRELVPRVVDGIHLVQPDGRRLINFGSNDYLGFAAQRSSPQVATGSMASALVCGWSDQHQCLVDRLAELETTESVCLFPTGFAACSGTVAALAAEGDLILSDQLNHASLIDGCRLSRAECVVYPHRDVDFVASQLSEKRTSYDHVWIVTDGVFSMDGHVAPLRELAKCANRYDAQLVVDEAHGTGVLGGHGSGVCEALAVKDDVLVRLGTLSKAIGGQGGFAAGPKLVIDYLINTCRTLIYSTALTPSAVATGIDAVDRIRTDPSSREQVQKLSRLFRSELAIESVSEIESQVPIIPVMIGGDRETINVSRALADAGFFVPAIRPPTVPEGTARLRVSLSAAHDEAMMRNLAREIKRQLR